MLEYGIWILTSVTVSIHRINPSIKELHHGSEIVNVDVVSAFLAFNVPSCKYENETFNIEPG